MTSNKESSIAKEELNELKLEIQNLKVSFILSE
jgi:hypothetical protein